MRRTLLLVAVVVSVAIAGCSGPQSTGTPTAEPTDDTPSMTPGVSNGTLTNATALATANGAGVVDDGATINVTRTTPGGRETAQLTVAAAGATELSRTMSADGVTLFSVGMGWGSESASEGSAGGTGATSSEA